MPEPNSLPLLNPSTANSNNNATDDPLASLQSKPLLILKNFLSFGAIIVVSISVNTQPLYAAATSSAMTAVSIIIDYSMYRNKTTHSSPKILDVCLLSSWLFLLALFLSLKPENQDLIKIWGPSSINIILFLVGETSILVGRPWIYQLAVDRVAPALYNKSHVAFIESHAKGFEEICKFLVRYYDFVFLLVFGGCIVQALNTHVDHSSPNNHLIHDSKIITILFGYVWSAVILVAANMMIPRAIGYKKKQLTSDRR